jgi:hypothetical protein
LPALGVIEPKDGVRVFTLPGFSRLGHLQHRAMTDHVLLHRQLERTSSTIETTRQSTSQGCSLHAPMSFDRYQREAIARTEDVLLKQTFELIVEGADQPIRVIGGFDECYGNRIAREP